MGVFSCTRSIIQHLEKVASPPHLFTLLRVYISVVKEVGVVGQFPISGIDMNVKKLLKNR